MFTKVLRTVSGRRSSRRPSFHSARALMLLAVGALALVMQPALAKDAPTCALRVTTVKGTSDATVPVAQFTRVAFSKSQAVAVEARYEAASGKYKLQVYRSKVQGDPRQLRRADFALVQTLNVAPGESTSISGPSGEIIAVNMGMGPPLDTSDGPKNDCTCCVLCDNGVQICGCRVNSSCGSCDGHASAK